MINDRNVEVVPTGMYVNTAVALNYTDCLWHTICTSTVSTVQYSLQYYLSKMATFLSKTANLPSTSVVFQPTSGPQMAVFERLRCSVSTQLTHSIFVSHH